MKLPSVYANQIDNRNDNNEKYYHQDSNTRRKDPNILKSYFDSSGYANKLIVNITTKEGQHKEKLILLKDNSVITIENKKIPLTDILDFEVQK